MARPSVRVVLAHYSENLSWASEHEQPGVRFTVYSKSSTPPRGTIALRNVGRESHTFLHHIVHKYYALDDWTVFSQAVRPSWGYHGGGEVSGHLSDRVAFADYLQPFPDGRDSFFVLNAVSQFPSAKQTNRVGFMIQNLTDSAVSKSMCPPGGADGWTPWWWDKGHPQLWGKASDITMLQFYHRFIAQDNYTDEPITLAFAQGARFAVSRARIQARPRAYYATLLEQLAYSDFPMEGYWMEAAWYDVFHPEALQSKHQPCPLPPPQEPLSIPGMQAEILRRARERGILSEDSGRRAGHRRSLKGAVHTDGHASTTARAAAAPRTRAGAAPRTSAHGTAVSSAHKSCCTLAGAHVLAVAFATRAFRA